MKKSINSPILKPFKLQLFFISFLILFLELALIRFIPSQIRYVGFFSNIILLASFVGIGLGTIFWNKIKQGFYIFPMLIFFLKIIVEYLKYDLVIVSEQVIFFNTGFGQFKSEPIFLIPLIFFAVVLIFMLPAKLLGELLNKFPPLRGYQINIAGSIAGVVSFSLLSFFRTGPNVWFLLVFIISIILIRWRFLRKWIFIYTLIFLVLIVTGFFKAQQPVVLESGKNSLTTEVETRWSPYYKISLYETVSKITPEDKFFTLNVNNIGHQRMLDPDSEYAEIFYQYPYQLFPEKKFENVLIIGSGGGNDVAQAINKGADNIVAVEIDPVIVDLGKIYHPEKPYFSSKVNVVIGDGRSYLVNCREKFDLVIFALTDSLTLTSGVSNLRLESYLFTKESFLDAKNCLKDKGLLVLYNYYRAPWIVDKIALLLTETFDRPPFVVSTPTIIGPAAVLIGANYEVSLPLTDYELPEKKLPIPTDDWPFLYLKNKAIPSFYLSYLAVIILIVGIVFVSIFKKTKARFNWSLFFLGAAFMLLETKNIVQFSLLFGSTWLTNSFVFAGLLILVLLAIWIAQRIKKINLLNLYLILFLLIVFNYFFPQRELLSMPYFIRLFLAVLINFSPVFTANLIFAFLFKKIKIVPIAYGSNIFGSFIGGIFEYSSLAWGYKNLMIFIAGFYFLSLLFALKIIKK